MSNSRIKRMKVAVGTAVLAGALMTPAAASAASGSVTCVGGGNVVGVWVNLSGGGSSWASRSGSGTQQRWSFDNRGRTYSLTVGCGGTSSNWQSSSSTRSYGYWTNVTCFPGYIYGGATPAVANTCQNG